MSKTAVKQSFLQCIFKLLYCLKSVQDYFYSPGSKDKIGCNCFRSPCLSSVPVLSPCLIVCDNDLFRVKCPYLGHAFSDDITVDQFMNLTLWPQMTFCYREYVLSCTKFHWTKIYNMDKSLVSQIKIQYFKESSMIYCC